MCYSYHYVWKQNLRSIAIISRSSELSNNDISDAFSLLNGAIYVTKDEVLEHAKTEDIEIILIQNRLRWFGHVVRMPDERPVKKPTLC